MAHFGILGMKWGKRNGPPYPLGSDISTGKRLKNTDKKKKNEASKSNTEKKTSNNDGYKKDEYGWLNKKVSVTDSMGKKVNLHMMIDGDIWDRNLKDSRPKTDEEIKKSKENLNLVAKDFKSFDKIAREVILDDMRDYLESNWDVSPKDFNNRLKDPSVRIDDVYNVAIIEYISPDTWHWHYVEIDIKTKKPSHASMEG